MTRPDADRLNQVAISLYYAHIRSLGLKGAIWRVGYHEAEAREAIAMIDRAVADARAENERLRAALTVFVEHFEDYEDRHSDGDTWQSAELSELIQAARAALTGLGPDPK